MTLIEEVNAVVVPYPGRVVKRGEKDAAIVRAVQVRLNQAGCGPIDESGAFDQQTEQAVKLFQARFEDLTGQPLKVDGQIGSITWGAMFGPDSVPTNFNPPSRLTAAVLEVALSQIGVKEQPPGSNRGPEVDRYLRAVGLEPEGNSFPWCVAFTHFCYMTAAERLGIQNPHIRTAGVLDHWSRAAKKPNVRRVLSADAANDPELIEVGSLFVIVTGGGLGHSGIVAGVAHGRLVTIEGNTNEQGSRNGIGVFKRNSRKITSINRGFIDYSAF